MVTGLVLTIEAGSPPGGTFTTNPGLVSLPFGVRRARISYVQIARSVEGQGNRVLEELPGSQDIGRAARSGGHYDDFAQRLIRDE